MTNENQSYLAILQLMQNGQLEAADTQWSALPSRVRKTARFLQLKGLISVNLKQHDQAAEFFKKAIQAAPKLAPLYVNLGNTYLELEKFQQAVDTYDLGMRVDPDLAELFHNRGLAFKKLAKIDEAIRCFRKAVKKKPIYLEAWNELALACLEKGDWNQAADASQQALRLNPRSIHSWSVKAQVALDAADTETAERCFIKVLELDSNQPEALSELSLLQLAGQRFDEGWKNYHYRWMSIARTGIGGIERTTHPKYHPDQDSRRVLVWSEQGVGDDIFFLNMLAAIGAWGPELVVSVDPRLVELLQRSITQCRVISKLDTLSEDAFDAHLPMGDLGLYLDSHQVMEARKKKSAYLVPLPERQVQIEKKLSALSPGTQWCGISWRSKAEKIGVGKSMNLEQMLPVLTLPGYAFINLQYGEVTDELAELQDRQGITVHQLDDLNLFDDMEGLAALISLCDAVVTVSNVTAHVSGALGRPTCLLRSRSYRTAIWYWRNVDDHHNLWYPTVETMIQSGSGEWQEAVEQVRNRLESGL